MIDAQHEVQSMNGITNICNWVPPKKVSIGDKNVSFEIDKGFYSNKPDYEAAWENNNVPRPDWCVDIGTDKLGIYADLEIGSDTLKFRLIIPGTFYMGSPNSEEGREGDEVIHAVTISRAFWLSDTVVTQSVWETIMPKNPSYFPGKYNPVEGISWAEYTTFMCKLNEKRDSSTLFRLPTEAEWEYSCRAGTTTAFYFGDNITTEQANFDGSKDIDGNIKEGVFRRSTVPVKTFAPNPWGLYEMHGNVLEICSDWYSHYSSGHVIDPCGPKTGDYVVLRGGSWYDAASFSRSAKREKTLPIPGNGDFGIRIACNMT